MRQEGRKIKAETEGEKERKAGRGDRLTERKKDMEQGEREGKEGEGEGGEKCEGSPFLIDPKSLAPLDFSVLPPVSETQGKNFPGMS